MNWRKNIVLVVGGGICLVLILAAGFMLFRYRSAYVDVRAQAQAAEQRLNQLNTRNPFPSASNVKVLEDNLDHLKKYSVAIKDQLRKGQADVPTVEPAEFAPMLEKAKTRVLARAAAAGVKVPERFGLGFARYAAGELPDAQSIPRLVTQLQAAEGVINLLCDARIAEISDMQREVFEGGEQVAAPTESRRRESRQETPTAGWTTIPRVPTNELFSAERIFVTFTAREASIWPILNTLAANPPFMVVVDVRFHNPLGYDARRSVVAATAAAATAPGAARGGAASARGAAAGGTVVKIPERDERVVAGREAIKVDLVLDVYRFADEAAAKEATP